MNNIEELRKQLSAVFQDLSNGVIEPKKAAEFANLAGKIIGSAKVQLEYCNSRKEKPEIDFLNSTKKE
jgi:hypothetical protein